MTNDHLIMTIDANSDANSDKKSKVRVKNDVIIRALTRKKGVYAKNYTNLLLKSPKDTNFF